MVTIAHMFNKASNEVAISLAYPTSLLVPFDALVNVKPSF